MWRHLYDVMNPSEWFVFVTEPAVAGGVVQGQCDEQDG
jgi:hypothetical protein